LLVAVTAAVGGAVGVPAGAHGAPPAGAAHVAASTTTMTHMRTPTRLVVSVTGDRLGTDVDIVLRGVKGPAEGNARTVTVGSRSAVRKLPRGTYTVTAPSIDRAGQTAVPNHAKDMVKVRSGRRAHASFEYRNVSVQQLSVGASTSCLLTTAGRPWCWSMPAPDAAATFHPQRIVGAPAFSVLDSGDAPSCGITAEHTAWCWRAGKGTTPVPGTTAFRQIASSGSGTGRCALDESGRPWCWIDPVCTGMESLCTMLEDKQTPALLPGDHRLTSLTAGADEACGLDDQGQAWCWDAGIFSLVGPQPPEPQLIQGGRVFTSIAVSTSGSTCGIDTQQRSWCWGGGAAHEVSGPRRFVQLAPGPTADFLCGREASGSAVCWGLSGYYRESPRKVPGGYAFRTLAVGGAPFSGDTDVPMGLTTSNAVLWWGTDGSMPVRISPVWGKR
jgi:hypothetical protein